MVCLLASPAQAQSERVAGPFAGLFGGGGRATNGQQLNVRASLFGMQQNVNVPAGLDPALLDPRFQASNRFGGVSGSIDYSFRRQADASSAFFTAIAQASDYTVAPKEPQYGFGLSGGLSSKLTNRVSFSANGQGAYASTYNLLSQGANVAGGTAGFFDQNLLLAPTAGLPSAALGNLFSSGDLGLTANLSQRSTLSATAMARHTFFIDDRTLDQGTLGGSVNYTRRFFRRLNFRATYRYEQSYFGQGPRAKPLQSVDFALDYGDALTLRLSRRTTLSMNASVGSARSLQGRTQYRLLGGATLAHSMARTWMSSIGASRSLGFVSAFREPVLQDMAMASLGGQLATRVSLTANASFMRGYLGLDTSRSFDSYGASAGLSVALARRISAFAQYVYYGSSLPANATNLPLLAEFSRRAAVVGVNLWAPLYTNPRARR
jgi:hypothetical protein